ncbi:MarR family winged helix-turn-helix transcriptional regulator [Pseudodonghicola flavimaris]|uniref:MarR family transcriptional regulator n=1 Tax=Pseudodonghicola flavimaris TaxID=3050036 RepID=A0ABT7F2C9_9RHOB|nr:MarR family transcriptional regulator [Pseudodonghicola flavimaris]MDK3018759.1 MarR family transcriptional regulator [Pseudodonghicola flavimaris]
MTDHLEEDSFRTSILYWIGVLEQMSNQQFVQEIGGGKSDVSIWRTLSILSELSGLTISELSRHTQIERTALSHLLTLMESQEMVERRPREGDKRIFEVHILPRGRETFAHMLPIRRAVFRRATDGVSPEELQAMMGTLHKLIDNLSAAAPPPRPRKAGRKAQESQPPK